MHKLLQFAQTAYVTTQNLLPQLDEGVNAYDMISRLVKKGDLIRLKNGFFLIAEKVVDRRVPFEQVANLLYGPSYISFEWALAYYNMIPEGVYVVTSASAAKSKSYKTPVATFDYVALSHRRYSIGIDQQENGGGRFLIATPEKALADVVALKCKKLDAKDLLVDLIEGQRIDEDVLKRLDKKHLAEIEASYGSKAVSNLLTCIGLL